MEKMPCGTRRDFLELQQRDHKPRRRGLTHVLDKGSMTARALEAQLAGNR